jgi:DNA polymerase-3 subunit beta
MKVQITQQHLNKALSLLSRVASGRTPLPILSNIRLRAEGGTFELTATNLEVGIVCTVVGKVEKDGVTTVPAKLLHDFVAQLPKDSVVTIDLQELKLRVKAGLYQSHIQVIAADDFPAIPTISKGTTLKLESKTLKNALEKTMLASSNDETRPVLGGVYFHSVDSSIFIAATDGYRLAEALVGPVEGEVDAVVPQAALQDTLKIIQDNEDDETTLQFSSGQFSVTTKDILLVSRLIDGKYPEYQQLIPENSDIAFTVQKTEFLTAVKLAGLFSRESGGSITIEAEEDEKKVHVRSVASQVGDNSSAISGDVSGSGTVVLNVRYITDALNCFDGEDISFRFSGSISPCVITSPSQEGYQHIVMPLKS